MRGLMREAGDEDEDCEMRQEDDGKGTKWRKTK